MAHGSIPARGLVLTALVPLLLIACAPAPDAPGPEPRSVAAAEAALRAGDLPGLRAALGKGPGLCARARVLADRLDPGSWLIAMGAGGREHDLRAAARAMNAGDDDALADALGFSEQELAAAILNGGASVFTRRADGRNYYETGPQPIDLAAGLKLPALPPGRLALAVTLWGFQGERRYRLQYSLDEQGVTDLRAALELGRDSIDSRAPRRAEATAALPQGSLRLLDLSALQDARWYGAELILLGADGSLERALLGRNEQGWALADAGASTLDQRLADLRDERLEFLRRGALAFERGAGRWPRGLPELSLKPHQLVDPAAPSGRLGWADFDDRPAPGLELGDGRAFAAAASWTGAEGRRAVGRDGEFRWLRP